MENVNEKIYEISPKNLFDEEFWLSAVLCAK